VCEFGNSQWGIQKSLASLTEARPHNSTPRDFEVSRAFPRVGHSNLLPNPRRLAFRRGGEPLIPLAKFEQVMTKDSQ